MSTESVRAPDGQQYVGGLALGSGAFSPMVPPTTLPPLVRLDVQTLIRVISEIRWPKDAFVTSWYRRGDPGGHGVGASIDVHVGDRDRREQIRSKLARDPRVAFTQTYPDRTHIHVQVRPAGYHASRFPDAFLA